MQSNTSLPPARPASESSRVSQAIAKKSSLSKKFSYVIRSYSLALSASKTLSTHSSVIMYDSVSIGICKKVISKCFNASKICSSNKNSVNHVICAPLQCQLKSSLSHRFSFLVICLVNGDWQRRCTYSIVTAVHRSVSAQKCYFLKAKKNCPFSRKIAHRPNELHPN